MYVYVYIYSQPMVPERLNKIFFVERAAEILKNLGSNAASLYYSPTRGFYFGPSVEWKFSKLAAVSRVLRCSKRGGKMYVCVREDGGIYSWRSIL